MKYKKKVTLAFLEFIFALSFSLQDTSSNPIKSKNEGVVFSVKNNTPYKLGFSIASKCLKKRICIFPS